MQEPFFEHLLGDGTGSFLKTLKGERDVLVWEVGETHDVEVADSLQMRKALPRKVTRPLPPEPEPAPFVPEPLDSRGRKKSDYTLQKEISYQRRLKLLHPGPPKPTHETVLLDSKPKWTHRVELSTRERDSLGRWLERQKQHVTQTPWPHPRQRELRFVRYPDQTTKWKFRVEMVVSQGAADEQRCLLPVDMLVAELERFEATRTLRDHPAFITKR